MVWKEKLNNKLLVILGPNASGKSALAIEVAKKYNGEIISADSRQVYKGMDIGSGKISPDTKNSSNFSARQTKKKYTFTHKGIPHYCIDVASPKRRFSVAQYQIKANKAIKTIQEKGKLPILCGGTGFYIQSVVDGITIPKVKPDWSLRKLLDKESAEQLFVKLQKLDPQRAKNIDKHNKRRLIRALEIVLKSKKGVPILKKEQKFDVLALGIKKEKKELKERIEKRLKQRLKQGMIKEVQGLKESGLSWKRLESFGLEYKFIAYYLQAKLSYDEMLELLQRDIKNYAKRQMTWFKKDKRVIWIEDKKTAKKLIKKFLKNKK